MQHITDLQPPSLSNVSRKKKYIIQSKHKKTTEFLNPNKPSTLQIQQFYKITNVKPLLIIKTQEITWPFNTLMS